VSGSSQGDQKPNPKLCFLKHVQSVDAQETKYTALIVIEDWCKYKADFITNAVSAVVDTRAPEQR